MLHCCWIKIMHKRTACKCVRGWRRIRWSLITTFNDINFPKVVGANDFTKHKCILYIFFIKNEIYCWVDFCLIFHSSCCTDCIFLVCMGSFACFIELLLTEELLLRGCCWSTELASFSWSSASLDHSWNLDHLPLRIRWLQFEMKDETEWKTVKVVSSPTSENYKVATGTKLWICVSWSLLHVQPTLQVWSVLTFLPVVFPPLSLTFHTHIQHYALLLVSHRHRKPVQGIFITPLNCQKCIPTDISRCL